MPDPLLLYTPWNSPVQNTGVGSLSLLQEIFPTQELNSGLLHCRQIIYQLSLKGSPRILEWVAHPFSSISSWLRNWTRVSCIAGKFFTSWAIRESLSGQHVIRIYPCIWLFLCFLFVFAFCALHSFYHLRLSTCNIFPSTWISARISFKEHMLLENSLFLFVSKSLYFNFILIRHSISLYSPCPGQARFPVLCWNESQVPFLML